MDVSNLNISNTVNAYPVSDGSKPMPEIKSSPTPSSEAPAVDANSSAIMQKLQNEMTTGLSLTGNDSDNKKITDLLDKAINEVNKKLLGGSVMEYGFHQGTKTVTVKLLDKETNEVLREVPAQKHLDAVVKMWELAGILVDEKR